MEPYTQYSLTRLEQSAQSFGTTVFLNDRDYLLYGIVDRAMQNWLARHREFHKEPRRSFDGHNPFYVWAATAWPPMAYIDFNGWSELSDSERRVLLAKSELVYSEQEEFWLAMSKGPAAQVER